MDTKLNLNEIFLQLKKILSKYEKYLTVTIENDSRYELWSKKEVILNGKKRKDMFFVSIIIQKSYVGFYFMPIYVDTEIKNVMKPKLLKLLKGKSCFHIINIDNELKTQIEFALKKGYELYKAKDWI